MKPLRTTPLLAEDVTALTRRERQVLSLAELGHPNKRIAFSLGISFSAVATFLTRARRKLHGVRRVGEEAIVAGEPFYSCAAPGGLPACAPGHTPASGGKFRILPVPAPNARITRLGERLLLVNAPIAPRFTPEAESVLTDAEKAVIELTLGGLSNAAIARKRRVSPRTIANQLAAAYKKVGVGSRRELAAKISGDSRRLIASDSARRVRAPRRTR